MSMTQIRLPAADARRALVMGVLNVTPDSFSDGGRFSGPPAALAQARQLVEEGADIIDVGGESTRPGARPVTEAEELERVMPVVEALVRELDCAVSIDTSKPAVMRAAVAAGAGMLNDVRALQTDGALAAAAELDVPVCLMHMKGDPRSMQDAPVYGDVVGEVADYLGCRAQACLAAGIGRDRIVLDPGFGFGKTLEHNLALIRGMEHLCDLGFPVLAGLSRKSMIGRITGRPVGERLAGSIALAMEARRRGAVIIRAHDVAPTIDALRILERIMFVEDGSG